MFEEYSSLSLALLSPRIIYPLTIAAARAKGLSHGFNIVDYTSSGLRLILNT